MGLYLRPERLEDALDALGSHRLTVLAGGTDFYPARVGRPLDDDVLDIMALADLRRIEDEGERWTLGALVTWTDLARADRVEQPGDHRRVGCVLGFTGATYSLAQRIHRVGFLATAQGEFG